MMKRDVWIKILSEDVEKGNLDRRLLVEVRQRFYREGKTAGALTHPNIQTVYELGEDCGISYIVFEALEGRTLREAIDAGISLRAGLPIILQVLDGLAHLHERGILHGDIQPANVFVCSDGCAKIMNFGRARIIDTGSGAADPGRSTDLLCVGSMLYEMVTGKQPDRADSMKMLPFAIVSAEPDFSPVPSGPQWNRLRRVITRALSKNRQDRYADAGAMRADLELALKELGDSADWMPPSREAPG